MLNMRVPTMIKQGIFFFLFWSIAAEAVVIGVNTEGQAGSAANIDAQLNQAQVTQESVSSSSAPALSAQLSQAQAQGGASTSVATGASGGGGGIQGTISSVEKITGTASPLGRDEVTSGPQPGDEPGTVEPMTTEDTGDMIKEKSMEAFHQTHKGSCACPYNVNEDGFECGVESAYYKPGGISNCMFPQIRSKRPTLYFLSKKFISI